MRLPQIPLQKSKAAIHSAQAVLVFVAGYLALAVLTEDGETESQVGVFFGLCVLTVPALIYQLVVPMWTRARRFAKVYAYAAIDISFTILWFAAFVALATWNSAGINERKHESKASDGLGASSAYGPQTKCEISKASVGFGVILWILFMLTSAISIEGMIKNGKTRNLPNSNPQTDAQVEQIDVEAPSKDPWFASTEELNVRRSSTTLASHHRDGNPDPQSLYGQDIEKNQRGLVNLETRDNSLSAHDVPTDEGLHPGRPLSYGSDRHLSVAPPMYNVRLVPSALSPSGIAPYQSDALYFPQGKCGA